MRMLSTSSLISCSVGVRNLNATHEKHLFRSLYTKEEDTLAVSFSFVGEPAASSTVPCCARIGFAFEQQSASSSLVSGKAKNLRAMHGYPSS